MAMTWVGLTARSRARPMKPERVAAASTECSTSTTSPPRSPPWS